MPISAKAYILIGLGIGLLVFLLGLVIGEDIANWARDKQGEASARGLGVVKVIIFEPVELVFDPDNRPWGAIIAGVVWPLTILWIPLVIIGLVLIPASDAWRDTDDVTRPIR